MECLGERSKHWRSLLLALISYRLVSSGEENCHGRGRELECRRGCAIFLTTAQSMAFFAGRWLIGGCATLARKENIAPYVTIFPTGHLWVNAERTLST
jgi:hypothetical protein